MDNLQKYGTGPFNIAVIHGGPGAAGEMAHVARELSSYTGVLEPYQTANTIEGQVDELKAALQKDGNLPLILIGFSWGAWLAYIFTAHYPAIIKKLIIVSSGAFEEKYAANIMQTRFNRLDGKDRETAEELWLSMKSSQTHNPASISRFGKLMFKADSYDPLQRNINTSHFNLAIYQQIWRQASELRKNGELLRLGKRINCPVVAIHGDYDSHLAEGVQAPLSYIVRDFRFILLRKCGHYPWFERNARENFYTILKTETGLVLNHVDGKHHE